MAAVMVLLTATTKVFARTTPKDGGNFNIVIENFIASHLTTDYRKLDTALNDEAVFIIPRQEKIMVQDRLNLIKQMKQNAGAKQNCEANYEILSTSDALVIARVNFEYSDFIQRNYVILEKNQNKDWKITQVFKISEDKEQSNDNLTVIAKI